MGRTRTLTSAIAAVVVALAATAIAPPHAGALPAGFPGSMNVMVGTIAEAPGGTANVATLAQTTDRAAVSFSNFQFAAGNTLKITTPSPESVTMIISDQPNPTAFEGSIQSTGRLLYVSIGDGLTFGSGASITADRLTITTAYVSPTLFADGAVAGTTASNGTVSVNAGAQLSAAHGVQIHASQLTNNGTISGGSGEAGLYGRATIAVHTTTGLLTVPEASTGGGTVDNGGVVKADDGSVVLAASVVTSPGIAKTSGVVLTDGSVPSWTAGTVTLAAQSFDATGLSVAPGTSMTAKIQCSTSGARPTATTVVADTVGFTATNALDQQVTIGGAPFTLFRTARSTQGASNVLRVDAVSSTPGSGIGVVTCTRPIGGIDFGSSENGSIGSWG
ncbi:hypothetical protein nbrc107696_20000 [Gordonia spumicola]|uniref:Uncharacterized protein n=1 Tax=Gordonia spumicola TaxID=589161 RepID=A0A7I9V8J0_9ACTN|nr:hypothetical protein [Gordonia spumicola]GEE01554.1 hypothetical protein nbrc107696_20000 [Gordonia spumicola]